MKIRKEIEFDLSDVEVSELIEALEEEVMSATILMKPEYQEKFKPIQEEMITKLKQVYGFIQFPVNYID